MTEKQPDWIDNFIDEIRGYSCGCISNDLLIRIINNHLPQESTYESGYQKGLFTNQEIKLLKWLCLNYENPKQAGMIMDKGGIMDKLESLLPPTK